MLKRLLLISRPIAWVGLSSFFWWGIIASDTNWTAAVTIGFIYFIFPGSLLVLGLNDISDIESDEVNPRKGKADGAIVREGEKRLIVLTALGFFLLFVAILIISKRYFSLLTTLLIALFAYLYSFPPFRLKNRPIIDSLSNGVWVSAIFLAGFYINDVNFRLGNFPWRYLGAFFISFSALHAFATLIDYEADERAGDVTIGTFLGKRFTALIGSVGFAVSALIATGLNDFLLTFYIICTLLGIVILVQPNYITIRQVKNIFYLIGLIPLPAVYLLFK